LAPVRWDNNSVHFEGGKAFWVLWQSANSDSGALRPVDAIGSQILVAAGHSAAGVSGTNGRVRLVAPDHAAIVEFFVEANNAACGSVRIPLRIVVTGRAFRPLKISVLQSLPGGDVDVVDASGVGSLSPGTGRSIPLVAEKTNGCPD
jgi:hypothetical protein